MSFGVSQSFSNVSRHSFNESASVIVSASLGVILESAEKPRHIGRILTPIKATEECAESFGIWEAQ